MAELEAAINSNPNMPGLRKLAKKVRGESKVITKMESSNGPVNAERIQGAVNNLRGIEAEWLAGQNANGVIAYGRKFSLDGQPGKVDVDVVAENGSLWIEVKNKKPFGSGSKDWPNLQEQALKILRSAEQNPMNGQSPRVQWDFPSGVSKEFADWLRSKGIKVNGPEVDL